MKETLAILREARSTISDRWHWLRKPRIGGAIDELADPVDFDSDRAVAWSLYGAIDRAVAKRCADCANFAELDELTEALTVPVIDALLRTVRDWPGEGAEWSTLDEFNECHTHDKVISALDGAIKRLEGKVAK